MNATSAAKYMARHMDRNGIVERWFDTRDARTAYLISVGCPPLLGWEDPTNDTNMTNVYMAGEPLR